MALNDPESLGWTWVWSEDSSSVMHGDLSADGDARGQRSEARRCVSVRALLMHTAVCVSALSCQIEDVMLKHLTGGVFAPRALISDTGSCRIQK